MKLSIPLASPLLKPYRHRPLICPNCGTRHLDVIFSPRPYSFRLTCRDCGFAGPKVKSLDDAFLSWERLVGRFVRRLLKIIR